MNKQFLVFPSTVINKGYITKIYKIPNSTYIGIDVKGSERSILRCETKEEQDQRWLDIKEQL